MRLHTGELANNPVEQETRRPSQPDVFRVRRLRRDDHEALTAVFGASSEQSRFQRFLVPVPQFTAGLTRGLPDVGSRHLGFVAEATSAARRTGTGRLVILGEAQDGLEPHSNPMGSCFPARARHELMQREGILQ